MAGTDRKVTAFLAPAIFEVPYLHTAMLMVAAHAVITRLVRVVICVKLVERICRRAIANVCIQPSNYLQFVPSYVLIR